ncbi:E3 ubiquitin-protein ligase RING1-like [Triticum urartu]|uniref:E3 ubiquitin-protein ligase RING1-like n=1 Tax=Triticum urartu TaxID=4572 RepID=UPI00204412D5|nr:E3 ubiquitin-protein ligase RING1-like [Triticum urartu]
MDSANGDNMAAGIMRLLMLMVRGPSAADAMPGAGGGRVTVHHFILGGDLFSGEVGGGVPPASKAAIASLKEVQGAGGDGEGEGSLGDCAICLDAFGAGKEMPCGHRFHGECLERWLGVHGSCPVCRHELPKADPAAEEQQQQSGDGERRGPRGAVLVSIVTLRGAERPQEEEQREEPINIRIEDVD